MLERLESLFNLGALVASADNEAEILMVILEHGKRLAGASAAVVGMVEGNQVRVVGERGYEAGYLDSWRTFPLETGLPMSDVIASGDPVFCVSREERDQRWPIFRGVGVAGSEAFVVLPLAGQTGVLGALTLTYVEEREFARDERAFLEAFSVQCALALERARAVLAEQRLSEDLSFLREATKTLARSLDYEETLAEVARLVVPRLADWFACDLLVGESVDLVAVSHVDPDKVRWAWTLRERFPPRMDAPTGLPNVLRTGRPEVYEVITDEMIEAAAETPSQLVMLREVGFRSAMIVPLIARGNVLGALTFVWAENSRRFGSRDLALAEELATSVAVAIDNSRLYGDQLAAYEAERIARQRTERLQRFTSRLAPALTIDDVAEIAVDKALVASGGATAVLALATDDEQQIEIRRIDGHSSEELRRRPQLLPRDHASSIGAVFRDRTALWLSDRNAWEQYPESIGRPDDLKSVAVLPVATATQFFGVLGIAFDQERGFPDDERRFLAAIAGQTAQALDRARLHEAQKHIAEVLQQSLKPRALPEIPGVQLATSYHAAGRLNETGGDFYDVFRTDTGYMLVIGDVCGKGPEAAALTSLCRYTLRACTLHKRSSQPAQLLQFLNAAILEQGDDEQFATVTCVLLEQGDGTVAATIASAGHPPTLLRRQSGGIEALPASGPPAGLLSETAYSEQSVALNPGDLIVLYTDGLTDARLPTGRRLGVEPIEQALAALDPRTGPDAAISALEALHDGLEITDDIALIAASVTVSTADLSLPAPQTIPAGPPTGIAPPS